MNFFETVVNKNESLINPEQNKYGIIEAAQLELIHRHGGDNFAGIWIETNSKRFREIIDDPKSNLVERLANDDTREEALGEIQQKLYH